MRRAQISVVTLLYFLAACGSPTKDVYNVSEVGQLQEVMEGRVQDSRFVDIDAKDSGSGTMIGGLAGGIGTLVSVGGGFGLVAFLLGSAVGAVVGYVVEDVATDRDGVEYILTLDDGRTVTVIQNRGDEEEPLPPGTEVFLQFGSNYTRVIERPKTLPEPWTDPDAWVNPDELPPGIDAAPASRGPKPASPPQGLK
ncbi:MAG: hypothetical protein QNJ30_01750 [Kiloniellales bacterium]|nr:hypothetical protein [Kiloniellales bacterium]